MFQFSGLGENAGSGLPKILDGWHSQQGRSPIPCECSAPMVDDRLTQPFR